MGLPAGYFITFNDLECEVQERFLKRHNCDNPVNVGTHFQCEATKHASRVAFVAEPPSWECRLGDRPDLSPNHHLPAARS